MSIKRLSESRAVSIDRMKRLAGIATTGESEWAGTPLMAVQQQVNYGLAEAGADAAKYEEIREVLGEDGPLYYNVVVPLTKYGRAAYTQNYLEDSEEAFAEARQLEFDIDVRLDEKMSTAQELVYRVERVDFEPKSWRRMYKYRPLPKNQEDALTDALNSAQHFDLSGVLESMLRDSASVHSLGLVASKPEINGDNIVIKLKEAK